MARVRRHGAVAVALLSSALVMVAATGRGALAQAGDPNWTATLVVRPTPSPYLSDWSRDPGIAQLSVFYRGNATVDYRIEAIITATGRGEIGRAASPLQTVPFGPYSQLYTTTTLLDWQAFNYDPAARDIALRTGLLPEGEYRICAQLRTPQGNALLVEACDDFRISYPDPPQLLAPANGSGVMIPQPAFQWMPAQLGPGLTARYRLRIARRLPSQAPQVALQGNIPQHEVEVEGAPFHVYPPDALPLEVGQEYVWQVELLAPDGAALGSNGRRSEIFSFTWGTTRTGPITVATNVFPDSIELIPGRAWITGLGEVSLRESPGEYWLSGRAQLVAPSIFSRRIPIELRELTLDRSALPAVRITAGDASAGLRADDIPLLSRGNFVRFTGLSFSPTAGMTLAGELTLPGRPNLPLGGRVRITPAGLDGVLTAESSGTARLVDIGGDPVRFTVARASVAFPQARASFVGGLELFGHDVGCSNVSGDAEAGGSLTVRVVCSPTTPLSLIPGVDRFQLALAGVAGQVAVDLTTGAVTPTLSAAAALTMDAGIACSADFELGVTASGVTTNDFRPNCDAGDGSAALGVVQLALSALRIERFGYTAGRGFDFAMALDATPSIPLLEGLAIPSLAGVQITRDGMRFPSMDVAIPGSGITAGGFGFRVSRVRLPAFTLSWTDWQANNGDGFDFGFDAALTLPSLGAGAPSCLAGDAITLRDVGIRSGRFRATIVPRDFATGSCVFPLGPAGFELTRLGGALAIGIAGPSVSLDSLPEANGAIVLPPALSCDGSPRMTLGTAALRFGPNGRVFGRVSGLAPPCPIDLAAVQVRMRDASLDLGDRADGPQVMILRAEAEATFAIATTPVRGAGRIGVDLVQQRLTEGSLTFTGPLRLDLPRENPVLSFELSRVTLDTLGITVDGRNRLVLPGAPAIATTFNALTLDPRTMQVLAGEARFDAPFGFEVGINEGGLAWRAVARGAALGLTVGLRVDLPESIILDRAGFRAAGTGDARLIFDGRTFESLASTFSDDFGVDLQRFAVTQGRLDLRLRDQVVATIDRNGFHPNLAVIGMGLLPARLPLPNTSVAYLQVRSAVDSSLLVDVETVSGGGLRVRTRPGQPVGLVFPALQGGRAAAPQVDVNFDLTFDGLLEGLRSGRLDLRIPEASRAAFDLTALGIPFAADSFAIAPGPGGGPTRVTLAGRIPLFGGPRGAPGAAQLVLDAGGSLAGSVLLPLNERIPLVSGSERIALAVDTIAGSFDVNFPSGRVLFDLALAGGVEMALGGGTPTRASARVRVTDEGVRVSDVVLPELGPLTRMDMGGFALSLERLAIPRLEYVAGRWDFELSLDAGFQFPGLGDLQLPALRGILITPTGLTIPEYVVPEFPASTRLVDLDGFQVRPLAFRMSRLSFDWARGVLPTDFGFGFDFELGFGGLPASAPPELRNLRVTVLDAGYRNGRVIGRIEPRELATPVPLPLGGTAGIDILRLGGTLGESGGAQDVSVTVGGRFRLPEELQCPAATGGALNMPGATLTVTGAGQVSGQVTGLVPQCPLVLGPLAVQVTRSQLDFSIGGSGAQQALFGLDGTLKLPPPPGGTDSIVAGGSLTVDLVAGRLTDGFIEITRPFGLGFPAEDPVLTFSVARARLDTLGFTLTGEGGLNLDDGARIGVSFNRFALDLQTFRVRSGSASFTSSFALGAEVAAGGGLQWRALPAGAPPLTTDGFRLVLPDVVGIDSLGLRVSGTARAMVRVGDESLDSLSVEFRNQFALGLEPFGVRQGRVDFMNGSALIAHLDSTGFWPGDVFSVIPIPDRLGLPDTTVAFLQLREAGQAVVETETGPTGLTLRTRAGRGVRLEIPALRQGTEAAPSVEVRFDVTVDPRTFAFVRGSITATTPEGQESLLPLRNLGIPIDITDLAYGPTPSGPYGLRFGARVTLPPSMGDIEVRFDSLTISERGFSGTAEVGTFATTYDPSVRPVVTSTISPELGIDVIGVRAEFPEGGTPRVRLAGALRSSLFAEPGSGGTPTPEAIFFTASVGGAAGFEATVDLAAFEGRDLPLGVATFTPASIEGVPALAVTANDSEFTVRLSGTFRVPDLARDFGVTVRDLSIGTRGITIPDVRIATPAEGQRFDLFGQQFVLRDSVGGGADYPALGFRYVDNVLSATMTGAITLFPGAEYENTSRFWGLTVTSQGNVSIAGATLLSRSIPIVAPDVFTLDSVNIIDTQLRIAASVRLPEPLVQARQRATIAINPDGTVSGSFRVVALADESACCTGAQFIDFGIAKVRVRHLSMTLDVADPRSGGIEAVVDAYLGTDEEDRAQNHIRIGDTSGGTVLPGLRIGFDGSVLFQNYALAREFNFDFEVLNLRLTEVAAPTVPGQFGVVISGGLSLNIEAVTGSIEFQRFGITNQGVTFPPDGIREASLNIADVLAVRLADLVFINRDTTLTLANPDGGASSDSVTVTVSQLISFAGSVSIGGEDNPVFAGSVERFLFYKETSGGTTLIIRRASLTMQNILELTADFRFQETATGFGMVLGAQARLLITPAVGVRLYGMVSNNITAGDGLRVGMFIAITARIDLFPAVALTEFGAGFFYRPRVADVTNAYMMAGLDSAAINRIQSSPAGARDADFAVMFYAAIAIVSESVVEGRVFISVTSESFLLYGAATLLDQGAEKLSGGFYLVIGLREAFAEGSFWIRVNYEPLVTGELMINFFIYSEDAWGIHGQMNLNLLGFITANSDIFVGPPGFLFSLEIGARFDIWIITISAGFEATIWYREALGEVGGYVQIYVGLELLGGLVSAEARLRGAFLLAPDWMLYASASLRVSVVGISWEGTIWAKAQPSGWSGGMGSDPTMDEMIARAQAVRDEMESARDRALGLVSDASATAPELRRYSAEELSRAYDRLNALNANARRFVSSLSGYLETRNDFGPTPLNEHIPWYTQHVLDDARAPRLQTAEAAADLDTAIAGMESERTRVQDRLRLLRGDVTALRRGTFDTLPASPLRRVSLDSTVGSSSTDAYGRETRRMATDMGFELDVAAARSLTERTRAEHEASMNALREVKQRITAIEELLTRSRAVLSDTADGSFLRFAERYGSVTQQSQLFLARQVQLVNERRTYVATKLDTLRSRESGIRAAIAAKTAYRASDRRAVRELGLDRATMLGVLLATDTISRQFRSASVEPAPMSFIVEQTNLFGEYLWYDVGAAVLGRAIPALDSIEADQRATGGARVAAVEEAYAAVSDAYRELAVAQGNLVGALADAYERYIYRLRGAPDLDPDADTISLARRRAQLLAELAVPRVAGARVIARNRGHYSEQLITWTASHPRGVFAYSYEDTRSDGMMTFAGLTGTTRIGRPTPRRFIIGRRGVALTYAVQPTLTTTRQSRSFTGGALGGAGFEGTVGMSYDALFTTGRTASGASTSTTVSTTDVSPPSAVGITITGVEARFSSTRRAHVHWIGRPSFEASWTASDAQSGISQYWIGFGSRPDSADIRPMTNYLGRTTVVFDDIVVSPSQPLYLIAQAVNGAGLRGPRIASAMMLRDTTPPTWTSGATVRRGLPGSMTYSAAGYTATLAPTLRAACPAPVPAMPREPSSGTAPRIAGGFGAAGSAAGSATGAGGTWSGALAGVSTGTVAAPRAVTAVEPSFAAHWGVARDAESGEVLRYHVRFDTVAATAYQQNGWMALAPGTAQLTQTGTPLDYTRRLYLSVVAENISGLASAPIAYGPFRLDDPTLPAAPKFCVRVNTAGAIVLEVDTLGGDPETGVRGYQYSVQVNGSTVRGFPAGGSIDVNTASMQTGSVRLPAITVPQGGRVQVSMRSVNGQERAGTALGSGIAIHDNTPPGTPTGSARITTIGSSYFVTIEGTVAVDPQSAVQRIEYAIGSREGADDIQAWGAVASWAPGGTSYRAYRLVSGTTVATLTGRTLYISVRAVNGAGLPSGIVRFRVVGP